MQRGSHLQLELFSETKAQTELKSRLPNSFLSYMRSYEKTILIIICFIITGIVSFSLGVEKGKKVVTKIQMPAPNQIITDWQPYKPGVEKQFQPTREKQDITNPPKVKDSMQNYTVQLASYQTKTYAEKEAAALKKQGLSPLVLSKGRYTVLCVGNFPNKEMAKSLISELKKRYRDCFVRRL